MLEGIIKEIKGLNKCFFQIKDIDEKEEINIKVKDKVEAFVDFLYRDDYYRYKDFVNEASYAIDEDDTFFLSGFELSEIEMLENYILACLSYKYKYRGDLFQDLFGKEN